MSDFHYIEFEKTGSILLNAEEKDELFDYIDRLRDENAKLRELVRDMWHDARLLDANHLIGGMRLTDLRKAEYESRMMELGVDA